LRQCSVTSYAFHDFNKSLFLYYGIADYVVVDPVGPTAEITQALLTPNNLLRLSQRVQRAKWREIGYRFACKADQKIDSNDLVTSDLVIGDSAFVKTKVLFKVTAANQAQAARGPLSNFYD